MVSARLILNAVAASLTARSVVSSISVFRHVRLEDEDRKMDGCGSRRSVWEQSL